VRGGLLRAGSAYERLSPTLTSGRKRKSIGSRLVTRARARRHAKARPPDLRVRWHPNYSRAGGKPVDW